MGIPIGISDDVVYRSVGFIWVITWAMFWSLLRPRLGHTLLCYYCPIH